MAWPAMTAVVGNLEQVFVELVHVCEQSFPLLYYGIAFHGSHN